MARLYADLPQRVMGLRCSQHRSFKMTQVLSHYKKHFRAKAKKEDLLNRMVLLEAEITETQKEFIRHWMVRRSEKFDEALKEAECSVCMEYFTRNHFPWNPITASCNHKLTTCCNSCIKQSVEGQIEDQPFDQISCPECPGRLTRDMVAKFSSPEAFERYILKQSEWNITLLTRIPGTPRKALSRLSRKWKAMSSVLRQIASQVSFMEAATINPSW